MSLGIHDIGESDLKMVLEDSKWPNLLLRLVIISRENFAFFTKTITRSVEYPYIVDSIGEIRNKFILDVGAGLSPLPLSLANEGAHVVTIDNSTNIRVLDNNQGWNEWGFFDYGCLASSIKSLNIDVLTADFQFNSFDVIYSVSVIEHITAIDRRKTWNRLSQWLKNKGVLLLTLDLIPETEYLWNYASGKLVEEIDKHGDLNTIREELKSCGFAIDDMIFLRAYHDSRTDVVLLKLIKTC